MIKNRIIIFFVAVIFSFCLQSVAFAQDQSAKPLDYSYEFTGRDKFEGFNRKIFIFNLKFNKYIYRPVNIVWTSIMPQYGIDRIKSAYNNINFPVRCVSSLIQKDFKTSKTELKRFAINTTLGIAGLYDPAKTKYSIMPREEDMGQALAYRKVKKGPYLVLPIIAQGNVRDVGGQILDYPLKPTSYLFFVGPISMISSGVSIVNNSTYMQPIAKKLDDTYADPYDVSKKLIGIERYIRNTNLDRKEVFDAITAGQSAVKPNYFSDIYLLKSGLYADVNLKNFNPQKPVIDSMRTVMFDTQRLNKPSKWAELSVWNRNFSKKFKISSVSIDKNRPNYKYRYLLQKDKTAPLAIIYPSFGEGILADKSTVQAKMLYDAGYSIIVQGSAFQWEFVKSMPEGYRPGLPAQDAQYLRMTSAKIIDKIQKKKGYNFRKKTLVGTSFGAMTALFVTAQDEEAVKNHDKYALNISNCIAINPPIDLFYALNQLDKYSKEGENNSSDIKLRAAITAQKIIMFSQKNAAKNAVTNSNKNLKNKSEEVQVAYVNDETLPFTEDEAKLTIGFVMKQKLSDVIFSIEDASRCKKCRLYDSINAMSFYDYAQQYLQVDSSEMLVEKEPLNLSELDSPNSGTSLYSLSSFLQRSPKYKIYHTVDDYFVSPEQLIWLKKQSRNKSVFFSNGSHLGELYRQEFTNQFENDIKIN